MHAFGSTYTKVYVRPLKDTASTGCCGLIAANVGSSNALWYVHGDVIAQLAKTGTAISITGAHGTSSAYVYTVSSTTPGLSVDAFSVYTIRITTT